MRRHHAILIAGFALLTACGGGGDKGRITFDLVLTNLPDLGRGRGVYEGFAVVDGVPLSTGRFVVDAAFVPPRVASPDGERVFGTVDLATFGPSYTGLGEGFPFIQDASDFFITIEADADEDPAPSGNVVMAGGFVGNAADLDASGTTSNAGYGLGSFATASGSVLLANPTDAFAANERGIWFVGDPAGAVRTLSVPAPTGSWVYEAWVSDGLVPRSLGKFTGTATFDFDAQFAPSRGPGDIGFLAPGQDFVLPVPRPAFAVPNLLGGSWRVEITVEPARDNDTGPFPLKILETSIPSDAVNAAGVGQRDVPLSSTVLSLPVLLAQPGANSLLLTGSGLSSLGAASAGGYACWAVVGSLPFLCGRFLVQAGSGAVTSIDGLTNFGTSAAFVLDPVNTGLGGGFPAVQAATEFFVTQEPQLATLVGPSDAVFLAGAVVQGSATLTVAGLSAAGGRGIADFSTASGSFVCLSPTNDFQGGSIDDARGVWFRSIVDEEASLVLPSLPAAWRYEGWVVDGATGERYSTGRFSRTDVPDEDALIWAGRGAANTGFSVPGQDFVTPIPASVLPGPLDLRTGYTVFVTLEPTPDTAVGPSFLTVLSGPVPATTLVPGAPLQNLSAGFPTGRVSFED